MVIFSPWIFTPRQLLTSEVDWHIQIHRIRFGRSCQWHPWKYRIRKWWSRWKSWSGFDIDTNIDWSHLTKIKINTRISNINLYRDIPKKNIRLKLKKKFLWRTISDLHTQLQSSFQVHSTTRPNGTPCFELEKNMQ